MIRKQRTKKTLNDKNGVTVKSPVKSNCQSLLKIPRIILKST